MVTFAIYRNYFTLPSGAIVCSNLGDYESTRELEYKR